MLAEAIRGYLQHLVVERGWRANTVESYRRDLRRYESVLARRGQDRARRGHLRRRGGVPGLAAGGRRRARGAGGQLGGPGGDRGARAARLRGGAGAGRRRPGPGRAAARAAPAAAQGDHRGRGGAPARCAGPGPDDPSADPRLLRDRALLEFLYGTGARISEATGLDVDELRLDADPGGAAGREGRQAPGGAGRQLRGARAGGLPGPGRPVLAAGVPAGLGRARRCS